MLREVVATMMHRLAVAPNLEVHALVWIVKLEIQPQSMDDAGHSAMGIASGLFMVNWFDTHATNG